jgi:hypothetical protein
MIDRTLQARHPKEPWLWRRDWAEKRVRHSHRRDGVALLLFALVWNGVCAAIAYVAFTGEGASPIKWVLLIFAPFGLLLLWGAIRSMSAGFRWPHATLLLNLVPQPLGRTFKARVEMPAMPPGDIWTSLTCVLHRTPRSHETRWKEERQVPRASVNRTTNGCTFPVEFELPGDGEETSNLGQPLEIAWTLNFAIGRDKDAPRVTGSFPIPVFGGRVEKIDEFEAALEMMPEDVQKKIRADIAAGR